MVENSIKVEKVMQKYYFSLKRDDKIKLPFL